MARRRIIILRLFFARLRIGEAVRKYTFEYEYNIVCAVKCLFPRRAARSPFAK